MIHALELLAILLVAAPLARFIPLRIEKVPPHLDAALDRGWQIQGTSKGPAITWQRKWDRRRLWLLVTQR
jgi:hypothetical protein